MEQSKLYHCCNTCTYRDNSFYRCSIASECYNMDAYSPNEEMKKQEAAEQKEGEKDGKSN